jgi:hypothetical protein
MYNIVETISHNLTELVETINKMQEKIDKLEKELATEKIKNKTKNISQNTNKNKENIPDWELPIQAY